jgi:hypothetical protein
MTALIVVLVIALIVLTLIEGFVTRPKERDGRERAGR